MPQVQIKGIEMVPINKLVLNPKNPNKHTKDQIKRLADIIEYQGWRYPVKVSKRSGFVTSGHGRIDAAKLKGWPDVPVSFQDYDSEAQEYADLVSDNSIAEWSELDFSAINTELPDLGPDFDLDLLGIKDFVLDLAAEAPLDDKPDAQDKGGNHILEVHLPNEQEMVAVYEELLSRGFIVKYK